MKKTSSTDSLIVDSKVIIGVSFDTNVQWYNNHDVKRNFMQLEPNPWEQMHSIHFKVNWDQTLFMNPGYYSFHYLTY